ncbi:MAG: hypothetical protein PVG49_20810 [Desulfobacteraceae bacterium]
MKVNEELALPWRTASSWSEALHTLEGLVGRHAKDLGPARKNAEAVRLNLEIVFPSLDALCRVTCPECPSPCCLEAAVYADFRDLLFLSLLHLPPPPMQLRNAPEASCRYHTRHGCALPRIQRPWICTWYLCAAQRAVLERGHEVDRQRLLSTLEAIRSERRAMEDAFLEVVVESMTRRTAPESN